MALAAATVLEVRTGGSDNNGGGFVTGTSGTDRSLQDAAHATLTVLSIIHTTTTQINVSLTDFTVSAADVGNLLQITGGTATAGVYQITTADVPNNRWTLDRSAGTAAQTVVGAMGGAFASPGKACGVATVAGQIVFVKYNATPYSITSATPNIAGGVLSVGLNVLVVGYDTTRTTNNTDTNRPTLTLNVASATMFTSAATLSSLVSGFICNGNSQTAARAVGTIIMYFHRCHFANFNTVSANSHYFYFCSATTCSAMIMRGTCIACEAYANTATPFGAGDEYQSLVACISRGNTGASTDGFYAIYRNQTVGCTAYGNGRDGFNLSGASGYPGMMQNCVSVGNGRYGFNLSGGGLYTFLNNAHYNNTSGGVNGSSNINIGTITLTADPFTNAAGGDLSLNNTAGGGAALRALGFPALFPAGLTANYLDIGAAQHQDSGGGSTINIFNVME